MKRLFSLAILIALTYSAFAQNIDLRRKIEVSGTAEQEVTPDIINVSVSLQEYMTGKTKITIDQLESQLQNAIKEAGIAKGDFTIDDIYANNDYWQKKKNSNFLASKQYRIRFHDLDRFNSILGRLDPKGIESTNIDSYDYSKMTQVKRELKIQALLAARDKATYLLSSLGEKLGSVIDINEVENNNYRMAATYANTIRAYNGSPSVSNIDFKKIKLSFQINAVFEIEK